MTFEKEIKKLLTPGCAVTNDDLHLLIKHCPKYREQAWDHLLGQPQTHRDLRWILYEAQNAEKYKSTAKQMLSELDHAAGRLKDTGVSS